MTKEKAIKILGDTIKPDGSLFELGHYMSWSVGDKYVTLDCRFDADELEAIAWWMKHNFIK